MITLPNGHRFEFMTASGALAFDGRGWPWEWPLRWVHLLEPELFTIVTKTLTRHPRKGNLRWTHPWSVVKRLPQGVANAIGLTNKGIDWWLREVSPRLSVTYKMVVSIEAEDVKDTVEMLRMLEGQKVVAVELNLSCPNSGAAGSRTTDKILEICRQALRQSLFPIIAKISYVHDYRSLAQNIEAHALSLNSVPWNLVFPDRSSPLARFGGGGVSGKLIQPHTWKMVKEISSLSKIPVIGPSVWEYEDIQKIFSLGAQAVSFGSIFVSSPWKPTLFVRRWKKSPTKNFELP